MKRKNPIRLPSSKEIFGHDDGTCETNTLVSLLEEGLKKKLKSKDKIIITEEYLPEGVCDNPGLGSLRNRKSVITYGKLNKLYEEFSGKKYSPEKEKERKEFDKEMTMRNFQRGWT